MNSPGLQTLAAGHFRPAWFLLASAGINLPLFWLLAHTLGNAASPETPAIIPVTLVEPPLKPPPELQPPEIEPLPERSDWPPSPQTSASGSPSTIAPPRRETKTPVIAAPDEEADADRQVPAPSSPMTPDTSPPDTHDKKTKAIAALRDLGCNRLGADRSLFCSDEADPLQPPSRAAFAGKPDMAPKEWAAFETYMPAPEVTRIRAEGCPPGDGVIKDVFQQDQAYYRQGVASAIGSLSKNSANTNCN